MLSNYKNYNPLIRNVEITLPSNPNYYSLEGSSEADYDFGGGVDMTGLDDAPTSSGDGESSGGDGSGWLTALNIFGSLLGGGDEGNSDGESPTVDYTQIIIAQKEAEKQQSKNNMIIALVVFFVLMILTGVGIYFTNKKN